MADLGNLKHTIEIIQKYQPAFRKRFDQNFLIGTHVSDKIISTVGIIEQDCVLGIGPGIGTMTQYPTGYTRRMVVMEIDSNLLLILDETLKGYTNITVVNDDILKVGVGGLVNEYDEGRPIKVAVNPPYYITIPTIVELFGSDVSIDNIMVMVQEEMANKMQMGPGSKDYGALSLAVQYYAEPHIVANIPPSCSIPRLNVGSAVIRPTRCEEPPVQVDGPKPMFKLVRAPFNQRRKILQNGLNSLPEIPYGREMTAKVIESSGVQPTIRGEVLNLNQFAQLSNYFTRNA